MSRRIPEIGGAAICFALAIAFAYAYVHYSRSADVSMQLVRVEATFSAARIKDVEMRSKHTMKRGDEASVDAVFQLDGVTYRHRVSEEYATNIVKKLPGKGFILVDGRDPTRPPRVTPAGFAAAPLLASIITALVGVMFAIAAWRHRKRAPDA